MAKYPELSERRRERLVEVMQERGLSQAKLAEISSKSRSYVSAIITRKKAIGCNMAINIEKSLGLDAGYLSKETASPQSEQVGLSLSVKLCDSDLDIQLISALTQVADYYTGRLDSKSIDLAVKYFASRYDS